MSDLINRAGGWPVRLPGNRFYRVPTSLRHLARQHEQDVMALFARDVTQDAVVLDLGAHWGLYTILAVSRGARVWAFEPSEANARRLEHNLQAINVRDVIVDTRVVSDVVGQVEFSDYTGTAWGLSMQAALSSAAAESPRRVPSTTVDALRVSPTIIKIDVEGAETQVVRGARRTLADARPLLFIEVHTGRLGTFGSSVDILAGLLAKYRYETHIVGTRGRGKDSVEFWRCNPQRAVAS